MQDVPYSETELAWAAGLFEGEGATQIVRRRRRNGRDYFSLRVVVSSTDREIVDFFCERWPGSIHARPVAAGHKSQFAWTVEGPTAAAFLRAVRRYLRVPRITAKVALALAYQGQKAWGWDAARVEYHAQQQRFYEEMAVLNQRGIPCA